jgi:hypothetical protein
MTKLRVLDFDSECRPLAYMGQDFTTGEVTAVAACWVDDPKSMRVWLLGRDAPVTMLEGFRQMYDAADLIAGHFCRAHDLPLLAGALLEYGLPPLSEKLVSDTKCDLVKRKHLSASQENLAAALGIAAPKVTMSNHDWREANRLTPIGLEKTYARVVGDVRQHVALRQRLIELDLLGPARMWYPRPGGR